MSTKVRWAVGGGGREPRPGRWSRTGRLITAVTVLAGAVASVAASPAARAGDGSRVAGIVWADVDRDATRGPDEVPKAGLTVALLSSPDAEVIASTTTGPDGSYAFADVADGDHVVRVDADGPFRFPATTSADNDVVRTGDPEPGDPERGSSAPFTVAGPAQVTGLDAAMQPIADLRVERLPEVAACEGFAITGLPPFDATDGPGQDSGPGNCVVRTGDTVMQSYSVSLTGLPTGAAVPNVVAEFTISSRDAAALQLAGPGTNGLPAGCLAAANGANPPSSATIDPDGSITVICNLGTMSSNVAAIQLAYRFTTDTPVPSHASVEMHASASGGDAGRSNAVEGPEVVVTGRAQWELEKVVYPSNGIVDGGPNYTVLNVDGVDLEGYLMRYQFDITDTLGGTGGADLVWPVTFTDVMPEFPNARVTQCRSTGNGIDNVGVSWWALHCPPVSEVQGADGWQLSIEPVQHVNHNHVEGHMVMTVFIPLPEMNRAIDPAWQPGDDTPTGTFDFDNLARDTDHWAMNGGALNFGDGHEPGWDGTGDNLATLDGNAAAPQWDLQKSFRGGPTYGTETVDGSAVDGYYVDYNLAIVDLAGPGNIAPWLDRPVTFEDRLVSHPGAVLVSCTPLSQGSPARENGTPVCETGVQPAGGWSMSFVPNQTGFDRRRGDIVTPVFIPLNEMPADPCESDVTLDLRNEAVGSEHWTAHAQPNNGTGFEPGWDGTEASGNNLDVRSIRPSANQCGSLTGDKRYIRTETGGVHDADPNSSVASFAGSLLNSHVSLNASSNRVSVTGLRLCDVFDVSTMQIRPSTAAAFRANGSVDPADYVIEYAVGPNSVDTQTGPIDPAPNLFPIDSSSLGEAAAGCRDAAGPWTTDPTTFGVDWPDRVNMVRVRPLDPSLTEVGPFGAVLDTPLLVRARYNGGPDGGAVIPSHIRLANAGGWPAGTAGSGWDTVTRQRRFEGPRLLVDKNVSPTQYLPGDRVVWDLNVTADRVFAGMTMLDLQVVDTIPDALHVDLPCTQALLPAGVTLGYDAATRQARFSAGDIAIVSTTPQQQIFHPTAPGTRHLRICTTVDTLAQPGETYVNTMQATAANSENAPTADATVQVVGSGQMGISKLVDKPFVASGEPYEWSLDWGNTSTVLAFQAPDVIDVLPWNGDGADGALSARDQFASDYEGLAQLTGPLAAPVYTRGGTGGEVPGTWYYATAAPATIEHDPRAATNADPQAAGGRWQTAAEVPDFGTVTAIRFVSDTPLPTQSRVRAVVPAVSTSEALDNVYVNRAMVFSGTFANQPLLSNEPYVQIPGFSIGDLVWLDTDGDGRFTEGPDAPMAGVRVEVLDAEGVVVGTTTTDGDGRWSVAAIPAGTYRARIPAAMFQPGGPLAPYGVRTTGASSANEENEGVSNNNTDTPSPALSGLTSAAVTLAYRYDDAQRLQGANGPTDDDVAGLAGELISPEFTNFTVDLAVAPTPRVDIEKATNGIDADEPPGPTLAVGVEVRWTYLVTNTGSTDLFELAVTDDRVDAAQIDCGGTGSNVIAGPLAPGGTFECVAMGVAAAGQYSNLGTVVATGPPTVDNGEEVPGIVVTDSDPSHYVASVPEPPTTTPPATTPPTTAPAPPVPPTSTPPSPAPSEGLPVTGAQLAGSTALAAALLGVGALLVLLNRRRERRS